MGKASLFDRQAEYFADKYSLLLWDAPGHGFRMPADATEADLPYRLECPALLISGMD